MVRRWHKTEIEISDVSDQAVLRLLAPQKLFKKLLRRRRRLRHQCTADGSSGDGSAGTVTSASSGGATPNAANVIRISAVDSSRTSPLTLMLALVSGRPQALSRITSAARTRAEGGAAESRITDANVWIASRVKPLAISLTSLGIFIRPEGLLPLS